MVRNQPKRSLKASIAPRAAEGVANALALGVGAAFLVMSLALLQRGALACADVGAEVALTPERRGLFEKRIERARKDLVAAQKEVEKVDQQLRNRNGPDASERSYLTRQAENWKKEVEIQEVAIRQAELALQTGKERIYKGAQASPGAQQSKGC